MAVAAPVLPWLIGGATAVSAVGQVIGGIQEKRAAEYNAQVQEQDAVAAEKKAKYDEGIHRERVKRLLSEQRATIGKSGVDIKGSPMLAILDTIEKGELDALAIRHGGKLQAQKSRSGATESRLRGKQAFTRSLFGAGSTLLSGGVKTYKAYKGI